MKRNKNIRYFLENSFIRNILNGSFWFGDSENRADKIIITENTLEEKLEKRKREEEHEVETKKIALEEKRKKELEIIFEEERKEELERKRKEEILKRNIKQRAELEDIIIKAELKIKQQEEELEKEKHQQKIIELERENVIKQEIASREAFEEEVIRKSLLERPTGYIDLVLKDIDADELFVKHKIIIQYLDVNGSKYIKEIKLINQGRELDCFSEGENKSLTIEKISSTQALLILEELNGNVEKIIVINGQIVS